MGKVRMDDGDVTLYVTTSAVVCRPAVVIQMVNRTVHEDGGALIQQTAVHQVQRHDRAVVPDQHIRQADDIVSMGKAPRR